MNDQDDIAFETEEELKTYSSWGILPAGAVLAAILFMAEQPCLGFFVLFGALVYADRWYRKQRLRMHEPQQRTRQHIAEEILAKIHAGSSPRRFAVYLRSFEGEKLLGCEWYKDPGLTGVPGTGQSGMWSTRLDDELAFALESELALVSLGEEEKRGRLGVPRLATTDAEWREVVELLFRYCSGIVLLPQHVPLPRCL